MGLFSRAQGKPPGEVPAAQSDLHTTQFPAWISAALGRAQQSKSCPRGAPVVASVPAADRVCVTRGSKTAGLVDVDPFQTLWDGSRGTQGLSETPL